MYHGLGQPGSEGLPQTPAAPTSDFLNITGGISAILAPLAQVGVSLYQTKQLQKLEKARMKAEAAAQNAMGAMSAPPPPVVVQSGSGALIGVIIGGVAMMGILVFVLTRKSEGGSTGGSSVTSSSSSPTTTRVEAPAPRIKRIKRVSRPRHAY